MPIGRFESGVPFAEIDLPGNPRADHPLKSPIDGRPADSAGPLIEAVDALALPPTPGQAYLLGESRAVRDLRDHLESRGIPGFCPRARAYFDSEEVRLLVACLAIVFGYYGIGRGSLAGPALRDLAIVLLHKHKNNPADDHRIPGCMTPHAS